MKRRFLLILLLLAGGAIVNVAVAWGLGGVLDIYAYGPRRSEMSADEHYVHVVESVEAVGARGWRYIRAGNSEPITPVTTTRVVDRLPIWFPEHPDFAQLTPGAPFNLQVWVHAYGWPMQAMYWARVWDSRNRSWNVTRGINLADIPHVHSNGNPWPRVLPLAPIWPGFAINSLFYAGIVWLLFVTITALRRGIRLTRGLCPKCAYPIGTGSTTGICPECGAALPRGNVELPSSARG